MGYNKIAHQAGVTPLPFLGLDWFLTSFGWLTIASSSCFQVSCSRPHVSSPVIAGFLPIQQYYFKIPSCNITSVTEETALDLESGNTDLSPDLLVVAVRGRTQSDNEYFICKIKNVNPREKME